MTLEEVNKAIEEEQAKLTELVKERDAIMLASQKTCMHEKTTKVGETYRCEVCGKSFVPVTKASIPDIADATEWFKHQKYITADQATTLYAAADIISSISE